MSTLTRTCVGQNAPVALNSGNANTGDSAQAITTSTDVTATLPIRIVDVVPETMTSTTAYAEVIVKINTHTYNNTTGI
jgi:methylglyoxal synthase